MPLSLTLGLAAPDEPDGLHIADGGLTWVGAALGPEVGPFEAGDPRLRVTIAPRGSDGDGDGRGGDGEGDGGGGEGSGGDDEARRFVAAVLAGDALGLEPLVGAAEVPPAFLHALAARCLAAQPETALALASGRRPGELRWVRALGQAAVRAGLGSDEAPRAPYRDLLGWDEGFTLVRVLPLAGDALALHLRDFGEPRGKHRFALWRPDGSHATLAAFESPAHDACELLPLTPESAQGGFALCLHTAERGATALWLYDAHGRATHAASGTVGSLPEAVTVSARFAWVHARSHHVALPLEPASAPALPSQVGRPARTVERPRDREDLLGGLVIVDGFLATFRGLSQRASMSVEEIRWVHLDDATESGDHARPWFQEVRAVLPRDGRLWVASGRGVWGLHPREREVFRWGHSPGAFDVRGGDLWMSYYNYARREQGLVAVDLATSGERWRVELGDRPSRVERLDGAVFASGAEWVWVRDRGDERSDGQLVQRGQGLHRLQVLRGPSGNVVTAGRDLLFLDERGERRRHHRLGAAVDLVGRLDGPEPLVLVEVEDQRHPPPGFWLFDLDGALRWVLPDRRAERSEASGLRRGCAEADARDDRRDEGLRLQNAALVAGARVLYRGDRLGVWTPEPLEPDAPVASSGAARLPQARLFPLASTVERGVTRKREGEPGLTVMRGTHVGVGCEYVAEDGHPALAASDGALVTLMRCHLRAGGIELARGSTALLIGCTEDAPDDLLLDDDCRLQRLPDPAPVLG